MKKTISCVCSTVKADGLHWRSDPCHIDDNLDYFTYKLKVDAELFYVIRKGENTDKISQHHERAVEIMNDLLYGRIKERIKNSILNIKLDNRLAAIDDLKSVLNEITGE